MQFVLDSAATGLGLDKARDRCRSRASSDPFRQVLIVSSVVLSNAAI